MTILRSATTATLLTACAVVGTDLIAGDPQTAFTSTDTRSELPEAPEIPPEAREHWAFQPVTEPPLPTIAGTRSPVDAFVLKRLSDAGLKPSPAAGRRTLIRRLYYTVTGLPPAPDAVARFVNNPADDAYNDLVDELLESPHYGEHWARLWLDVARYSDTKGYVYGREERFWAHAWSYRDWVVDALNRDLPYDEFLRLQLAADQIVDDPAGRDLAAMGFLTLGRRFQGIEQDIIDDRIDVVTRGTMALTVSCARCHDHMYDPIPTDDYYSLYGIFASSQEELVSIGDPEVGGAEFQAELKKRRDAVRTKFVELRAAASKRSRERLADYLFAQTELEKYPAGDFDQIFSTTDLLPGFVHRWADYLRKAKARRDPVFVAWNTYAELSESEFAATAAKVQFDKSSVHPAVAAAFATPPQSMREVADRYGKVFATVNEDESSDESLRTVLFGPGAVAEVPELPIVHSQRYFDTDSVTRLYRLEGEVYRWINQLAVGAPQALVLRDRAIPVSQRVYLRGNSLNRGDEVPRRFPLILAGARRESFATGSGRLELARAIVAPSNPLTARVIVNRVWAHHFGRGLVDTPSDFGLRSDPPTHPELLDWLTSRFVTQGWRLKTLHRWILRSATFRQSSNGSGETAARAMADDPGNRLLWRMNVRRLSWEQFRDSMLTASGELDRTLGGKPVNLFVSPYPTRRTLYGLVDRQFLPSLLRAFDFANPDLHIPKRAETTVPQQALFFMNDPMVLDRARAIARYARKNGSTPPEQIRTLFRQVWHRDPTDEELSESEQLLAAASRTESPAPRATVADWQYGFGVYDEKANRVDNFTKLPHFTGAAWQGGPKWPDAKLGWVQLTAEGGHPGNTRDHACVRRWTAPRAMMVTIRSHLVHEPGAGDGIRAFIVSSRSGSLATATIHKQTIDLNVERRQVEAGETIDFVVDIGGGLNNDQYLWSKTIEGEDVAAEENAVPVTWSSRADFTESTVGRLDPWEQLAQALLCSNEFLFVD